MKKERTKKVLKILGYALMVIIILLTSFSLCFNLTYTPVVVSGTSMFPTLKHGDFGYVKSTKNAINNIERNDIIIFNPSTNLEELYIKRVIALPGETFYVDSSTCDIKINGETIPQSYISDETKLETCTSAIKSLMNKEITLAEDEYFVLGDNRGNSLDSLHGIGFVKKENIDGILNLIIASCEKDSFKEDGSKVCNFNQRSYYSITEWKFF